MDDPELNSADFALNRDAQLKPRPRTSPPPRMMPEMVNTPAPDDAPPDQPRAGDDEVVDYDATSKAVLQTLRRIRNNTVYDAKERREIARLVGAQEDRNVALWGVTVVAVLIAFFLGKRCP